MEDKNNNMDIPELSEALASELRRSNSPASGIPARVDHAVLAGAREHFAAVAGRRVRFWRRAGYFSAAAGLIFAFLLFTDRLGGNYSPYDIDRNGSVDILDAMQVAVFVRDKGGFMPGWDFDKNNVIDDKDVDMIAFKAVELNDLDPVAAARLHAQLAMIK